MMTRCLRGWHAVQVWMSQHQRGRRHLPGGQMRYLRGDRIASE